MNIEKEIEKGNFVLGECAQCRKTIWPPSDYCNVCFGEVVIKKGPFEGKIIEFSKKEQDYFCLAKFSDHVKIIGSVSEAPQNNQRVHVKKCGIKNGSYFFEFSLIR
ncbi:hypothetical protein NsoK4_04055 [Nitrosopumilus sp. K4]|uniref:zinc ribbon domain-containing protein n=1 Tax=Nitrosopumilus sp. K4 TaxID=2795383 RepID=UPI001BA45531|nr:hypothetical protein [Nitrosopumilus sp. K4]QUC65426.1 hypothetical protein NsoK4_04055 [Nitrosopumilus sp. K4]